MLALKLYLFECESTFGLGNSAQLNIGEVQVITGQSVEFSAVGSVQG